MSNFNHRTKVQRKKISTEISRERQDLLKNSASNYSPFFLIFTKVQYNRMQNTRKKANHIPFSQAQW